MNTFEATSYCGAKGTITLFDNGNQMVTALTPCCEASGKGNADVESGVVCRGCHKEVSFAYGMVGDLALRHAAEDQGCPCPEQCSIELIFHLEEKAGLHRVEDR